MIIAGEWREQREKPLNFRTAQQKWLNHYRAENILNQNEHSPGTKSLTLVSLESHQ